MIFEVATATYRGGVKRWPAAQIILRHGARVVRVTGERNENIKPRRAATQ